MPHRRRLILFSGGGTVGHLAPGFALADQLAADGFATAFATPGEAAEGPWFEGRPAPWTLPAVRLPRSAGALLAFPLRFGRGVRAARRLFAREGVGCVVALGGWPCAPAAWAARQAGVPLAFLVPDAVPGLVVRRLARRAGRLYLADERARAALGAHPGVRVTGPLLRSAALRVRRDPGALGLEPGRRTLFVTGGSLGAAALDERWLLGLEAAVLREPSLTGRLQVLHSVGRGGEDVAARYRRLGVRHRVTPFVQDMGAAYGTADLVLCRAGAGTCAELAAARAPAVLVPYPHHADRQQFHNAAPLVEAGAVVLVEQEALDPAAVQREVLARLFDEPALQGMRAAFPAAPRGGVAETAGDLVRFLGWGD